MSTRGDVVENPVTGERVVIRQGTEDTNGKRLEVDLYVQPGGAVVGEHVHPSIDERFTVLRGRVGFRLDGREEIAVPGRTLHVPAGTPHDWWNAGDEEAHVRVEIEPVGRFEEMILNFFGLAQDGKTNEKGIPHLLQRAVLAREYTNVLYLTRPPLLMQRLLFGPLALLGGLLGYRASYPEYLARRAATGVPIEPDEEVFA